jgi:hypothetical protein
MRELPAKGCNYTWSSVGPTPDGDIGTYYDTSFCEFVCIVNQINELFSPCCLSRHALLYLQHNAKAIRSHTASQKLDASTMVTTVTTRLLAMQPK